MTAFTLSTAQRRTLAALCHTIAPAASGSSAPVDLPAAVEARVATWDRHRRREFRQLLDVIDSRVAALALTGAPGRFTHRSPESRTRWLARWERSRVPLKRTVFQALRRTILSTYYALPESWAGIGYRGPYHTRTPAVDWEGPLRAPVDDPGPVAVGTKVPAAAAPLALQAAPTVTTHPDGVVRADVCVIGSGAGGAVAAARLAEAGRDVVILEAGAHWASDAFNEDEATVMPARYAERANRSTDDLAIPIFQGVGTGGGSTVNWMIMLRTPDHVLEEWSTAFGMEGVTPAAMEPVFERIEDEVHARTVPDAAHNPNNRVILRGAEALGWPARRARINARDCVRAGFCGLGCRYDAKQSVLLTYLPRAVAAGARLFADARVTSIEVHPGFRRVRVTTETGDGEAGTGPRSPVPGPPGGEWVVEAKTVMLAAGAVESPIVLQRSGLGGPAVGRFLRLHPTTAVGGRFAEEIYPGAGIPQSAYCDHFLGTNGGYGFWIEGPPVQPGLASIAVPGFGAAHRAVMERYRHNAVLIALVRDGADRARSNGRVWAGRDGRTHIRYRLGPVEQRTMRAAMDAALRMMLAAGAEEAFTLHAGAPRVRAPEDIATVTALPSGPNQLGIFSAHVNGTCRIGRDPGTSVCTPDGQVRGAPGVYVCDGSLLPTAPGVNPQETIMALASVLAERLVASG